MNLELGIGTPRGLWFGLRGTRPVAHLDWAPILLQVESFFPKNRPMTWLTGWPLGRYGRVRIL